MDIQHKQTGNNGSFFAESNGKVVAEMTYSLDIDTMTIDHTEAAPELKGQNAGTQLLNTAVQFARDNGYKIIAVCPFVRSVFTKHADKYKDINVT